MALIQGTTIFINNSLTADEVEETILAPARHPGNEPTLDIVHLETVVAQFGSIQAEQADPDVVSAPPASGTGPTGRRAPQLGEGVSVGGGINKPNLPSVRETDRQYRQRTGEFGQDEDIIGAPIVADGKAKSPRPAPPPPKAKPKADDAQPPDAAPQKVKGDALRMTQNGAFVGRAALAIPSAFWFSMYRNDVSALTDVDLTNHINALFALSENMADVTSYAFELTTESTFKPLLDNVTKAMSPLPGEASFTDDEIITMLKSVFVLPGKCAPVEYSDQVVDPSVMTQTDSILSRMTERQFQIITAVAKTIGLERQVALDGVPATADGRPPIRAGYGMYHIGVSTPPYYGLDQATSEQQLFASPLLLDDWYTRLALTPPNAKDSKRLGHLPYLYPDTSDSRRDAIWSGNGLVRWSSTGQQALHHVCALMSVITPILAADDVVVATPQHTLLVSMLRVCNYEMNEAYGSYPSVAMVWLARIADKMFRLTQGRYVQAKGVSSIIDEVWSQWNPKGKPLSGLNMVSGDMKPFIKDGVLTAAWTTLKRQLWRALSGGAFNIVIENLDLDTAAGNAKPTYVLGPNGEYSVTSAIKWTDRGVSSVSKRVATIGTLKFPFQTKTLLLITDHDGTRYVTAMPNFHGRGYINRGIRTPSPGLIVVSV